MRTTFGQPYMETFQGQPPGRDGGPECPFERPGPEQYGQFPLRPTRPISCHTCHIYIDMRWRPSLLCDLHIINAGFDQ